MVRAIKQHLPLVNLQVPVFIPTSVSSHPNKGFTCLRKQLCLLQGFLYIPYVQAAALPFSRFLSLFRSPWSRRSCSVTCGSSPHLSPCLLWSPLCQPAICSLLLCILAPAYLGSWLVDFVGPLPVTVGPAGAGGGS